MVKQRLTPIERAIRDSEGPSRRQRYEARQREMGIKTLTVRVHVDDHDRVKRYVARLRAQREAGRD